jgi:hypothetical protein
MAKITVRLSLGGEMVVDDVDNFVHSSPGGNAHGNDGIEMRRGNNVKAWVQIGHIVSFTVEGDLIDGNRENQYHD